MDNMTNGDIIRSMTNEQLAEFLANEAARIVKPVFDYCGYGLETQVIYAKRLQWLNEPVYPMYGYGGASPDLLEKCDIDPETKARIQKASEAAMEKANSGEVPFPFALFSKDVLDILRGEQLDG